ncbi:AI-2E family transporter [Stomatohabitans albus]|uniref:AI-2E family transporter n=1 Tax=Stomatohabitans albus TaxID=3110766 RepID=UPI00300C6833
MAAPSASTQHSERLLRTILRIVPGPALFTALWCFVIILALNALQLLGAVASKITLVIIPLALAVLLSMLLNPVVDLIQRWIPKLPRGISAIVVVIAFFGIALTAVSIAITELIGSAQNLSGFVDQSIQVLSEWLKNTPLNINSDFLGEIQMKATEWIQSNWQSITNNAVALGSNVAAMGTSTLLLILGLIYFLADGKKIWRWVVKLLPKFAEEPTYQAFRRGAKSLGSYVRTMLLVACFDATIIGLASFFLGVPLLIPIVILIFLGVFIPLVGPVITGLIVILVALAGKGVSTAVLLAIIVFATQQIDANVLQPLLLGNAVNIHPLAVLIAITVGSSVFGLIGMVFAVPVVALINTVMRYYVGQDPFPELGEDITLEGVASSTNDNDLPEPQSDIK